MVKKSFPLSPHTPHTPLSPLSPHTPHTPLSLLSPHTPHTPPSFHLPCSLSPISPDTLCTKHRAELMNYLDSIGTITLYQLRQLYKYTCTMI